MARVLLTLKMTLLSDAVFASGSSTPAGEDISLKTDSAGSPYLAGSTFKGIFRDSLKNYLCWTAAPDGEDTLKALLGEEGRNSSGGARRMVFNDFHTDVNPAEPDDWSYMRAFTQLENGTAKEGSLRLASCLKAGLIFRSSIICAEEDTGLTEKAIKGIKTLGLMRNRGFGEVSIELTDKEKLSCASEVSESNILHYRFTAMTPVSIPWLERSGSTDAGNAEAKSNFTETRSYIPGSAVRGMVINALHDLLPPEEFEKYRMPLLRDAYFMNALPETRSAGAVIPYPAGYYGDKALTRTYSVLNADVQPGDKRLSNGSFCTISGEKITGFSPELITALRIRRSDNADDREVFTTRSIAANTEFEGYIAFKDPKLAPVAAKAFTEQIWLGADRYAGSGLCSVTELDNAEPAYIKYGYTAEDSIPDKLYLMLLSDTTMTENGEPAGIAEAELARRLGVKEVKLDRCATSITASAGYNTMWKASAPSVTMYKAGSIFKIICSAAPEFEKIRALEMNGIGVSRQEGCGRVLFLKNFEQLQPDVLEKKRTLSPAESYSSKLRCAEIEWIQKQKIPGDLSKSQLGNIQAYCDKLINSGCNNSDIEGFERWLYAGSAKQGHSGYLKIGEYLRGVYSAPLEKTLGITVQDDTMSARFKLIVNLLKYDRRVSR